MKTTTRAGREPRRPLPCRASLDVSRDSQGLMTQLFLTSVLTVTSHEPNSTRHRGARGEGARCRSIQTHAHTDESSVDINLRGRVQIVNVVHATLVARPSRVDRTSVNCQRGERNLRGATRVYDEMAAATARAHAAASGVWRRLSVGARSGVGRRWKHPALLSVSLVLVVVTKRLGAPHATLP
jgi:hypothetical protein